MKKIISLLLVLIMSLGIFTGCSKKDNENKTEDNTSTDLYSSVLPGAKGFTDVDFDIPEDYDPTFIEAIEVKKEINGIGYAMKLKFSSPNPRTPFEMTFVIGVGSNKKITGLVWTDYDEKLSVDKNFSNGIVDCDINELSFTFNDLFWEWDDNDVCQTAKLLHYEAAWYAIKIMCLIENIHTGEYTHDEWLAIELNKAMPEAEGSFTKIHFYGSQNNNGEVYEANNGAGYVCIVPGESWYSIFVAVGTDGNAYGNVEDPYKEYAENFFKHVLNNIYYEIDLSKYADNEFIANKVVRAYRFNDGRYSVVIETKAYSAGLMLEFVIDSDGIIQDAVCIQTNETMGVEQNYGKNFIGLSYNEIDNVALVSGVTMTTGAYKQAAKDAIKALTIFGEDIEIIDAYVVVSVDGKEVCRYLLSMDGCYELNNGTNTMWIQNRQVSVIDATCPDMYSTQGCVGQGAISKNGETIICLPNKLIIEIVQENAE